MKHLLLVLFLISSSSMAQQAQSPEAAALGRMREAMKQLTQRIATADAATAEAQAKQFAAEAQVKDLESKLKSTQADLKTEIDQRKADQESSAKKLADTEAKVKAADAKFAESAKKNADWKKAFDQVNAAAEQRGAQLAEAKDRAAASQRRAEEHERKNREMYQLGTEILDRYKKFGLGTALLAREPFVGSMKVKFQNYIQDYGDKLQAQKIDIPSDSSAKPQAPAP
jgi:chromosome segregation ATPase